MENIKYSLLDPLLQDINKNLKTNEEKGNQYINAFEEFSCGFRTELSKVDSNSFGNYMKINKLSHAVKSQMGISNEFDMHVSLKIPPNVYKQLKLSSSDSGQIQIKSDIRWPVTFTYAWSEGPSDCSWLDDNGYLSKSKINWWMQRIMENVVQNIRKQCFLKIGNQPCVLTIRNHRYKFTTKKSESLFTLKVEKIGTDIKFDVNIVPSIIFEFPLLPWNVKEKCVKKLKSNEWLAAAKYFDKDEDTSWCPLFFLQEAEILSSPNCLKDVIRLLTALRDNNDMSYLSTYYINTVLIWLKQEESDDFCEKSLSEIFIEIIIKLEEALSQNKLLSFWNKNINLLDNLKPEQRKDASKKLKNILKIVTKNALDIEKVLCG